MANLRQVNTPEQVDREAECIKRFLASEKEAIIIAWGTKEGMESYQEAKGHEISGILRLVIEPFEAQMMPSAERPKPRVVLEEGQYITYLGRWLKSLNLEGKKVKIIVEEIT